MAFEYYIRNGTKKLRCGYTTGTCAALAAAGAVRLLLTGQKPVSESVMTAKGIPVEVEPDGSGIGVYRIPAGERSAQDSGEESAGRTEQAEQETQGLCENSRTAWCAVRKDGGDDIDATHGMLIVAQVRKSEAAGVEIDGGCGIGRVTKPGLDQPAGNAAINRVPRQMIEEAVLSVCDACGYDGGIKVLILAPEGEEIAKKTFNPVLGVTGGISILGTSGIVEPMSEQALVETIEIHMRQAALLSKAVILIPGNYGEDFIRDYAEGGKDIPQVKISNFLGEALDLAVVNGFEQVLLVSHIGKLVKVAGGIMNTHSKWADCRLELFAAHAACCGADRETVQALMDAATTDAAIRILDEAGIRNAVMERLMAAVETHLKRRVKEQCRIGAVAFSNEYGFLGATPEADRMAGSFPVFSRCTNEDEMID